MTTRTSGHIERSSIDPRQPSISAERGGWWRRLTEVQNRLKENMARVVQKKKLDRHLDSPKCPKCGRVDIVALTGQPSRSSKKGVMILETPQLSWRCIACKHEWPR